GSLACRTPRHSIVDATPRALRPFLAFRDTSSHRADTSPSTPPRLRAHLLGNVVIVRFGVGPDDAAGYCAVKHNTTIRVGLEAIRPGRSDDAKQLGNDLTHPERLLDDINGRVCACYVAGS